MHHRMYRLHSLVVLLFIATLASSCVSADPPASPTPDALTPTTISFAAPEAARPVYERLISLFNADNPDISVQFVPLDQLLEAESGQQMRQIASAADTAVVFALSPADYGFFRDLRPLMEADPSFDRSDFYPGAFPSDTADSAVYLLPHTLRLPLLAYNKDRWIEQGLAIPTADWNWRDLRAAAEQITDAQGDTVNVYGLLEWQSAYTALLGELAMTGNDIASLPPDQLRLDQPAMVAALEQVAALSQAGVLFGSATAEATPLATFQRLITEGQAGMWRPEMLAGRLRSQRLPFAVGTAPFPAALVPFYVGSPQGYVLSSGSQQPQAAWRWLAFLSSQQLPQDADEVPIISRIPARKSIAEQSGFWTELDAEANAALRATLDAIESTPARRLDPALAVALNQALDAVLREQQEPAVALAAAQQTLLAQQTQSQETPQPSPVAITVATPIPSVAPAGTTSIVFNSGFLDTRQLRRVLTKFYEQHPDIFVEIREPSFTGVSSRLPGVIGSADCIAWFGGLEEEDIPALLDLQPLIDADASFDSNDIPAALLAPLRSEGGLYGLPYEVALVPVMGYNPDLFDSAGLPYPDANWTLDDLLLAAQQLTQGNDEETKQYGFAILGLHTQALPFFVSLFDTTLTVRQADGLVQPNFTDPKVIDAIRFYLDLLRNASPFKELQGYKPGPWPDEISPLIRVGRVGLWLDVNGAAISGNRRTSGQAFTPRFVSPPLPRQGLSQSNFSLQTVLHISAKTQHPEACWTWLKFLSSDIAGLGGGFPARHSLATSEEFSQQAGSGATEVYESFRAALEAASNDQSTADPPGLVRLDFFWLYQAVERAYQGGDLERELQDAQYLTEQHLACIRSGGEWGACTKQVDPNYQGEFAAP